MAATVKCDTIVNASSATNNLALDASGNVTVGAGLTLTGGALNVGGSVGTAGQILKSNGTTSSWVNGWTLINTVTGTGVAALQDTTSLTSTYSNYMILVRNLIPATNGTSVTLSLYISGAYQNTGYICAYSAGGTALSTSITTGYPLTYPNMASNTYPITHQFYISNPSNSTAIKCFNGVGGAYATSNTNYFPVIGAGTWTTSNAAVTGFQIAAASGNITGTVQIYGTN